MSSQAFERDVIEYFAPLYGFEKDKVWGIVTHSGTDGNNHGTYFGANYLYNKTGKRPIVYVSDEAHYSNMRLCGLQNLEVRLIKSDAMGRMIPEELEKALDTSRPTLMVYAMGSTFKGAIDDQDALNAVLDRPLEMPVYRHVDAALFGGYLPFTAYRDLVSHKKMRFDAIAISGHKFFGIDSPSGLFLSQKMHMAKPEPEIFRAVDEAVRQPDSRIIFIDDIAVNRLAAEQTVSWTTLSSIDEL